MICSRNRWVGASWEGHVIEQALAALAQTGEAPDPHFFRTSDGREIDLLITVGGTLWAIEVKLTSSPSEEDLARLDRHADLVGADRRILISRVSTIADGGRRVSGNLEWLINELGGARRSTTDRKPRSRRPSNRR